MSSAAQLGYWLGPWSCPTRSPRVARRTIKLWQNAPNSYLYVPTSRPTGSWLISPGLHWLGPDDPRLDRLAKSLANSGYVVLSSAIPDLIDLRLTTGAIEGLLVADEALRARTGFRPAVFSVSVGSL